MRKLFLWSGFFCLFVCLHTPRPSYRFAFNLDLPLRLLILALPRLVSHHPHAPPPPERGKKTYLSLPLHPLYRFRRAASTISPRACPVLTRLGMTRGVVDPSADELRIHPHKLLGIVVPHIPQFLLADGAHAVGLGGVGDNHILFPQLLDAGFGGGCSAGLLQRGVVRANDVFGFV